MEKHCKYCDYKWNSIKENPKVCPRCKNRMDWGKNKEE